VIPLSTSYNPAMSYSIELRCFINSYLPDIRLVPVEREARQTIFRHGLAFYGTVAFVAAFFGSRLFATLNPTVVVVHNGIHFHHFWYGLAMVVSSGWAGIALSNEKLGRDLAIVFGLGAGLIGDEVGLLLTFGDYTSNLTQIFFVGVMAFVIIVTLFSRGRSHIEREVVKISLKERLTQIGVFVAGFSVFFFAIDQWAIGLAFLLLGLLVFVQGFERKRRSTSLPL
jgi:hypothetical protein